MAIPLSDLLSMQRRQALRLNSQIVDEELTRVLRQAAADARQMAREVASVPGVGGATRSAQLRMAADGAEDIAQKLWFNTGEMTREGIFRAADLAAFQSLDVDKVVGMPLSFVEGYSEGILASARNSAEAIIQRRQFGYTLSQRVLRNERLTAGRINRVIESALANNLSARELSRRVGQFIDPKTPGGASYAAKRLARTEINNAYHWVSRDQMEKRPWIAGVEWNLSGSHPRPDICDDFAEAGPYPKDEVPDKPHPQCLCFITPSLPSQDEFLDALLEGDYNDWLEENGRERIVCSSSCKVTSDDGSEYQRWDTVEEQEAWLEENFDRATFNFTPEELDILDDYVSSPSVMNGVARGDINPRWTQETIDITTRKNDLLSYAINESSVDRDIITYRGLSPSATEKVLQGKTFTDPGFVSTSLDIGVSEIFTGPSGKDLPVDPFKALGSKVGTAPMRKGYIMEIQVPRGSKGIGVPEKFTQRSGIDPERELLLDRGSTFQILGVDHVAGKILARLVN